MDRKFPLLLRILLMSFGPLLFSTAAVFVFYITQEIPLTIISFLTGVLILAIPLTTILYLISKIFFNKYLKFLNEICTELDIKLTKPPEFGIPMAEMEGYYKNKFIEIRSLGHFEPIAAWMFTGIKNLTFLTPIERELNIKKIYEVIKQLVQPKNKLFRLFYIIFTSTMINIVDYKGGKWLRVDMDVSNIGVTKNKIIKLCDVLIKA